MQIQSIITFVFFTFMNLGLVYAESCDAVVDEFSSARTRATTAATKVKTSREHLADTLAIAKKNLEKNANKKRQNYFSSPPRNRVRAEEMEKQVQGMVNGYAQSNKGIAQEISSVAKKLEFARGDEGERYRAELIRLQEALLRNEKSMIDLRDEMSQHWQAVKD